jgi:hypothetical protein
MPSTPNPIVGPMGVVWTAVQQSLHNQKQAVKGLAAQAQQGAVYDQYGNIVSLTGSNLQQAVSIGATWIETAVSPSVPGGLTAAVFVSTGSNSGSIGIQNGTAGTIVPQGLATGTITLTKGSTAATIVITLSGTFATDQMIGAYVLNTVTGVTTQAITPGTYIDALSGTSITLSEPALETGTALYCAAAIFALS